MPLAPGDLLFDHIAAEIAAAGGAIPFADYMRLCLYEPHAGYYSSSRIIFGKAGDFYTASDVHAVYAHLLSRYFVDLWQNLLSPPHFVITELGAGKGQFAADLLAWCEFKYPKLFQAVTYIAVESSAVLRTQIEKRLAAFAARVSIVEGLHDCPTIGHGCVFANEFFDALPDEIVRNRAGRLERCYAVLSESTGKRWLTAEWRPISDAEAEYLFGRAAVKIRPETGDQVEFSVEAPAIIAQLARLLRQGELLIVDYGYTEDTWRAGRFRAGTLSTYRRHQWGGDPFERPGEQDITAHVNFSALQRAALTGGFTRTKIATLSEFLLRLGERDRFAGLYARAASAQEKVKLTLQLNHMLSPAGLGEIFQVLQLTR